MPRAVQIRTLFLALIVLLIFVGFGGWIWNVSNGQKVQAEYHDLLAQRYLLECARAVDDTRDNVTEKIAPLEGKSCEDPLLSRSRVNIPEAALSGVVSSKITVVRRYEPYSEGEYTVTVRYRGTRELILSRGAGVLGVGSP